MRRALPLLGLIVATAAAAQDSPPFGAQALEACVAERGAACIGQGATDCIAAAGSTSAGVCLGAEAAFWRGRVARAEGALRDLEPQVRARAQRLGLAVPSVDAVAQRFADYRDAACGWRVAQWDGMHPGPEEMACILHLTAQHALWLEDRVNAP